MIWLTLAFAGPRQGAVVDDLFASGLAQTEAWDELVELCDDIGPRLSGSAALDRAIRWAAARMEADGLAVTLQPVEVPAWTRGAESARLLAPVDAPLTVLGLGGTVPTPAGGIEAEVVVARDWDALDALGDAVAGKIVLFDPPWSGYGPTVTYRVDGADRAAARGAVGLLIRSVTPESLATPHTGMVRYRGEARIPAAAVTVEDAERIRRWAERGVPVRARIALDSTDGTASSANVIGEVVGRKRPKEVVLLGCHLDSWDVGTGAQDDGAACVAAMEAVASIAALKKRPQRTVRAVLFTNEENGVAGGRAYAEAFPELTHVALIESDSGMGRLLGFAVEAGGVEREGQEAAALALIPGVRSLLAPLEARGPFTLEPGGAGADVGATLRARGGLGLGVVHDMTGYWPIHHTEADTLDKIDRAELNREVAILAALAWTLAEADDIPGAPR